MGVYVVDSNFFIQAHRIIYPLDVAEGFWKLIAVLASDRRIISIDKVRNEILQNDDELSAWCTENLPANFFKNSSDVVDKYGDVVMWAMSKKEHYLQGALDEFLDADEADAWLVAYALKTGCVITTYERSQPDRKNKIKIPEPCLSLGIYFVDTIDMFRQLGVKF